MILALAYFAGGFSNDKNPMISKDVVSSLLVIYLCVMPIIFIVAFIFIGHLGDRERRRVDLNQQMLAYDDPFELPSQKMRGYKLALITGREPEFRGLTGDAYTSDDSAICTKYPEHTPPVASCECGYYAYRNRADAKFEGTLNPGTFLLQVDLYGIGFEYRDGYRAETQVVNEIILPKRCMRCRVFAPTIFVVIYKMGFYNDTWMQWQVRCNMCTMTFKDEDKLSITDMYRKLGVNPESAERGRSH